jgi:hypothetical protein
MNFIEELFGLSPDDGSGALELLLFLVPLLAALAFLRWRAGRSKS